MRIGAFTTFAPEYTFAEACQMIKSLGYQGVQPRIVPPQNAAFDPARPFNPWNNNKGGISETRFFANPKAAIKPALDAGLKITSVASYTDTADMKRAVAMIKACSKIGVKNVRIGALHAPAEEVYDLEAFLEKSKASYLELVAEAKKYGVRPCMETHPGHVYPSATNVVNFLKGISPKDVGILWDPANAVREGWEPFTLALNAMGPYLAEVHVKNAKIVPDTDDPRGVKRFKSVNCSLEDGFVNWPEVVEKLAQHGYDGWLIEEGHEPDRNTLARLKGAAELLKKLLAGVKAKGAADKAAQEAAEKAAQEKAEKKAQEKAEKAAVAVKA